MLIIGVGPLVGLEGYPWQLGASFSDSPCTPLFINTAECILHSHSLRDLNIQDEPKVDAVLFSSALSNELTEWCN